MKTNRAERIANLKLPLPVPACAEEAKTLSQQTAYLLSIPRETLEKSPEAQAMLESVRRGISGDLHAAFVEEKPEALLDVHRTLYAIYEASFANPLSPQAEHATSAWLAEMREKIETEWLRNEIAQIQDQLPTAEEVAQPDALCAYLNEQAKKENDLDKRVVNYLAHNATHEQFKLFVLSDAYLNYRFYDAIILSALHYSETVKAEIAHHVWDECGEGRMEGAHTYKFTLALEAMNLELPVEPVWEDWRPYAGHNLYFLFGLNRRHYFKALGSLAMPELFDPDRDTAVVRGLERFYPNAREGFAYYYDHIELDAGHGSSWLGNVIAPIVRVQPEAGTDIAIGGALRMVAMRRYNEYLATRFGLLHEVRG